MTKEELFLNSQRGVAAGFALPAEDGDLQNIRMVELDVSSRSEDAGPLATRLIAALGTKPAWRLYKRGEQLCRLFDEHSKNEVVLAIVITSAHLLRPKAIYELRSMTEFSNVGFRKYSPAIILLGHVDKIQRAVARYPGVLMRSIAMPASRPQRTLRLS